MLLFPRKMIVGNLLLSILALALYPSRGETSGSKATNWRFFTATDGLGESWASFVTVSSSDKVWVSHGSIGLLSHIRGWPGSDGQTIHTMISPGDDLKVYESNSGQLWSLYSNGIQQFKDGQWIRYQIDAITNRYPADIIVRTLIPFLPGEEDQCYYLMDEGLYLFNAETQRTELILGSGETKLGEFIDMNASRDGGIWITGEKGAAKLSFESGTLAPQCREYLVEGLGLSRLEKPTEGENGELLAIARNQWNEKKLLHFDGVKWSVVTGYQGTPEQAWFGLEDSYWVVKRGNTLSLLENGREEVQERIGILAGDFFDVATEENGVFWISTSHGVARYAPSVWRTPVEIKDVKDRIHAIHEDSKGRIWFAAVYNLLLYQSGHWKKYPLPEGLQTQAYFTRSICSLPDGRIAIGIMPYRDFLLAFNPEKERFEYIPHVVKDTLPDPPKRVVGLISQFRDGRMLVQTLTAVDSSIYRLETFDGNKFEPFLDMSDKRDFGNLRDIYQASNGDLWLGGQKKLAIAVYRNGEYTSFIDGQRYLGTGGFCINEVEDGKIWVGGRDEVMEYYKGDWKVVMSGLTSVRSIMRDRDGNVWVASGTGVHRRFQDSWVTNTAEDGLANTAVFKIFKDSRGRTWAGTINGLSLYDPGADIEPPRTVIPEEKNLKEAPPAGEVRLIFTGVDKWRQTATENLLYSSRMDNGEWSPFSTDNVALFDNLPYGKHIFEVRAMDTNLNYDPQPAAFEFTVMLPWYKEAGFQVLAVIASALICILMGYAIYRHLTLEKLVVKRTSALQDANIELEEKITELTQAKARLLDSQKMEIIGKIASGVAHEVRNPLSAILAISEALFKEVGDDPEYKPYMDNVRLQVDRLSTLMNDLLEIGKPIHRSTFTRMSLYEICSYALELWRQSASSDGGRKVRVLCPQGDRKLEVIVNGPKINQVFFNLLENAMHHSPDGTEITITLIKQRDKTVQALVKDQGEGIKPEIMEEIAKPFFTTRKRGTGLGLSIVKSIVENHGGSLRIFNNDPPPGVTVEVELPLA
jgi:signal transduction histidine kinase